MKSARAALPSRRTSAALVVLLSVVALLGVQIAPLWHFAFVRHALCAEHGELIHVDGDAAELAATDRVDHARASAHQAPAPGSEHSHEATFAAGTSKIATLALGASAEPSAVLEHLARPAPKATWQRVDSALYHLAPKSSPPALRG